MKKKYLLLLVFISSFAYGQVTLPHEENFDYVSATNLGDTTNWTSLESSGDLITLASGNLAVSGLKTSKGNKISFGKAGRDETLSFTGQSGAGVVVYYSLILNVTDNSSMSKVDYLLGLTNDPTATTNTARGAVLYATRDADGTSFNLGITKKTETTNAQYVQDTGANKKYTVGTPVFVVVGYDWSAKTCSLWVNPSVSDLGTTLPPTEDVLDNTTNGALGTSVINGFFFKQTSNTKTPNVEIDELKIATSWADVTPPSITWDGSTDKNWNDTTNWTPERVPPTTAEAIIPAGLTNYPTISSGAITVGTIDIKSGAAFVANGTATVAGTATYSRNLTHTAGDTNGWYAIASPVVGETFDDTWVNANSLATGSGTNRGLATYTESADTWDYFLTGESGTFTPGTGYSVKRSATGDVSFTGTINTADTDVTLVRTGNGYNLVTNPYTSYINSETLLDNNAVVSSNKNIYVWNNGTTSYDTKISTEAFKVAPGQAFFVKSNAGGGTLNFAESNQSDNSGTDTFQRTAATIPEIELSVADESTHRYIKLYFNDAATKSFDNGYDGDLFGGIANSFEIYSHLLADNQGEKYQIQSLPNSGLASTVIPVGLKAASGKELAFSVKKLNLPTDIKVYLEDRVTNTFSLFDETNSVYNITLSSAIDGVGRFYLHTSNSVLSTSDVNLNSVSIFKINNSTLRVAGLSQGKASISLYNILGKQMMMTTFNAINSKDISLPKLAAGVYIVQLTTEAGKLNKKIILK